MNRHFSLLICVSSAIFMLNGVVLAIPANPQPVQVDQPGHGKITIRPRGDERSNWIEDEKGHPLIRKNGQIYYAKPDARGQFEATQYLVGTVDPRGLGLKKGIRPAPNKEVPTESYSVSTTSEDFDVKVTASSSPTVPITGLRKNLVILCRFADHDSTKIRPAGDFDIIFNKIGGDPNLAPTGSVKDFYIENSYGAFTLESVVTAWLPLLQTEAYYAGDTGFDNARQMVSDALSKFMENQVDYNGIPIAPGEFDVDGNNEIDAITIIHSGYGAEYDGDRSKIWSHKWQLETPFDWGGVSIQPYHTEPALWANSGNEITRIGVIAHELGHFLGLPDLYDTDQSSQGIGAWGVMSNSWGFDGSQLYPGHFCAWSKVFLQWVTPIEPTAGENSIPAVENLPTVYIVKNYPDPCEYLLIENRQPIGFDSLIPHGGLAIWHIDESKGTFEDNNVNNDEGFPGQSDWPTSHFRVALIQADGEYHLERNVNIGDKYDLYYGGVQGHPDQITTYSNPSTLGYSGGQLWMSGNLITNISPSDPNMTFNFNFDPSLYGVFFVDANSAAPDPNGRWESPYKTIQDAVDDANDGFIIVVADGTYKGVGNFNIDPNDPNHPEGKDLTIISSNGPENCIIDCNNAGRAFLFINDYNKNILYEDTYIDGFTIRNGYALGNGDYDPNFVQDGDGGAIYCSGSSPVIANCVFENCFGERSGGAIWMQEDSSPYIYKCTFRYNEAIVAGGAICSDVSSPFIENCLFYGNQSEWSSAIAHQLGGVADIFNCTIADNNSNRAIAVDCLSAEAWIVDSIIWNNGYSSKYKTIYELDGHVYLFFSDVQVSNWVLSQYRGFGNINYDPLFASPSINDYHLRSTAGRYTGQRSASADFDRNGVVNENDLAIFADYWDPYSHNSRIDLNADGYSDFLDYAVFAQYWLQWIGVSDGWAIDDVSSPCIDAGYPGSPYYREPSPNGRRINMGAYGNTAEASKSPYDLEKSPDMDRNGRIEEMDLRIFCDYWLLEGEDIPADFNDDEIVNFKDYSILADVWFQAI